MEQKNNIQVDAVIHYIESQSEPENQRYVFAYTINIENRGTVSAKLLGRHWFITDSNGKVQEVLGDGVVGEQPLLKPGEGFQYTSAALIETPVGIMRGNYKMITEDGELFIASIPQFTLSIPRILH